MTTQLSVKILYKQDFNLWIETTAKLLREGKWNELDLENLIEEIETLGRSERKQLKRRFIILIAHLLYLTYWYPEAERKQCSRGWKLTVREQRNRIKELLNDSPSLTPYLYSIFQECYTEAKEDILFKSPFYWDLLPIVPEKSPFTFEDSLNSDYLLE